MILSARVSDLQAGPLGHIIDSEQTCIWSYTLMLCVSWSNVVCFVKSIVFGVTRSELEPTINRTRGDHVNHFTTDAVERCWGFHCKSINFKQTWYGLFYAKWTCLILIKNTEHLHQKRPKVEQELVILSVNMSSLLHHLARAIF